MVALQNGATGTGHIEAIIVVIAIVTAIFWCVLLKIPLMIALLLFIILMASSRVDITDV